MYQSWYLTYYRDLPNISKPVAVGLGNVSHVAATSIQGTLYVFICASTLIFRELRERMSFIRRNNRKSCAEFYLELERWRQYHDLACSFVGKINRCFGPCLLITVIYSYAAIVKYSLQFVNHKASATGEDIRGLVNLAIAFMRLFMLLYASQTLELEVIT